MPPGRRCARVESRRWVSAAATDPRSTAEAPSLRGDALQAVMVPSPRKTGLRAASFSAELPGRMPSSLSAAGRRPGVTRSS